MLVLTVIVVSRLREIQKRLYLCLHTELRDFEPDAQQEIEVDEGNTAVIECQLPESQPQAQVRYSVKQEWLDASRGEPAPQCPPLARTKA